MSQRFTVRGVGLSQRQAETLCKLVSGPMPVATMSGWDRNCVTALADHDLVDLDDKKATITAQGREAVVELNAKINGDTKRTGAQPAKGGAEVCRDLDAGDGPHEKRKPATRGSHKAKARRQAKPRRDSRESPAQPAPPQGRLLDLDKLRASVEERYRSDLAAIDRLAEVAAEVG